MLSAGSIARLIGACGAVIGFLAIAACGGRQSGAVPPASNQQLTIRAEAKASTSIVHSGSFTLYKVPVNTTSVGLANGPGNTLWFPDCSNSARLYRLSVETGALSSFVAPAQYTTSLCTIADTGSDLFYFVGNTSTPDLDFVKLNSSGSRSLFNLGSASGATNIAQSADGRLWFVLNRPTTNAGTTHEVSRLVSASASGVPGPSFALPSDGSCDNSPFFFQGQSIASAPDGNLYIVVNAFCYRTSYDKQDEFVFKVSPSGAILRRFKFPSALNCAFPACRIAAGPDGNLWIANGLGNAIVRMTPSGVTRDFFAYVIPSSCKLCRIYVTSITKGTDGALWFVDIQHPLFGGGAALIVGRITPSGAITEYTVPPSLIGAIAYDPAGIPGTIISCPTPQTTAECGQHGGVWVGTSAGILRFDFPP